jgi:hypothetical protein
MVDADDVAEVLPVVSLFALPEDIMEYMLANATLAPLDICRLEQCSHECRALLQSSQTGEDCWQRVFRRHRRPPVLVSPRCWKSEYAMRSVWSRLWREERDLEDAAGEGQPTTSLRPRCLAPEMSACRSTMLMAMQMLPTGTMRTPGDSLLVVDPADPKRFASIHAALACAEPHDTIVVAPGTYYEQLEIDKPLNVVGAGDVGAVRLVGGDGPVVHVKSDRVAARVSNLTIEQRAAAPGVPMRGAVRVEGGGVLCLEDCSVSSAGGHGVVLKGAGTCGYIVHNEVRASWRSV